MTAASVVLCNCTTYEARKFIGEWIGSGASIPLSVHAWQSETQELLVLPSGMSFASIAQTLSPDGFDVISKVLRQEAPAPPPLPAELPANILLQEEHSPESLDKLLSDLVLFQSYLKLRSVEAFKTLVLALYSMWRGRALRRHQEHLAGGETGRVVVVIGPVLPSATDVLQSISTQTTGASLDEGKELSWPFGMCDGLRFSGSSKQADLICALFEDLPQIWPALARALVRPQNAGAMFLSNFIKQALGPDSESLSVSSFSGGSALISTPSQLAKLVFRPNLSDSSSNVHLLKRAVAESLSNGIAESRYASPAGELHSNDEDDGLAFSTIIPEVARKLCERYDREGQWSQLYEVASNWYAFDSRRIEPLFYLIRALRQLGQDRSAMRVAQISAAIAMVAPPPILMGMAQEHMRMKNFTMALEYLNTLPAEAKNKVSSLTNRGICEYNLGRLDTAISHFEQALTLKSTHEQALKYIQLARSKLPSPEPALRAET